MITVKPIVVPSNRRKDGTYLVYVRVYYAGAVRRLPTSIVCKGTDITRSGRIKNPEVQERADKVADRMRDAVSGYTDAELSGKDVDWVVRRMKCADTLHNFRLDFFEFGDGVVASKGPGARGQYVTALNAFAAFLGKREIDVNDITRPLVAEFLAWMRREMPVKAHSFRSAAFSPTEKGRIQNGAESRHTAKLAHIYGKAKERYNDEDEGVIPIPRSPFRGMLLKHPPSRGQRSLGVELMQKVIDGTHYLESVRTALDLFVVSFALMGANLSDLYEAVEPGEVWMYRRRKTRTRRADGAEMRVTVPEVISGRLGCLERLRKMAGRREYATAKVNKGLARWCADEGVPVFTFYAARHTWATLARKAGVEKATVDECLCHVGDFPVTDIYAERDWELMDKANRKVLELFDFTGGGGSYISGC